MDLLQNTDGDLRARFRDAYAVGKVIGALRSLLSELALVNISSMRELGIPNNVSRATEAARQALDNYDGKAE